MNKQYLLLALLCAAPVTAQTAERRLEKVGSITKLRTLLNA